MSIRFVVRLPFVRSAHSERCWIDADFQVKKSIPDDRQKEERHPEDARSWRNPESNREPSPLNSERDRSMLRRCHTARPYPLIDGEQTVSNVHTVWNCGLDAHTNVRK